MAVERKRSDLEAINEEFSLVLSQERPHDDGFRLRLSQNQLKKMNLNSDSINRGILEEFHSLNNDATDMEVANEATTTPNIEKNRYRDVLPNKETQVKLKTQEGRAGSEYINANFVTDRTLKGKEIAQTQKYISCQAPLPNTFQDYWRMIWEQNSPLMVMLTKFQEKNRWKADRYWPEHEGDSEIYGDIKVTHVKSTYEVEDLVLRKFTMQKNDSNEIRTVHQLHYTQWPDRGIPETPDVMVQLVKEVDKYKAGLDNPIVVHCSAGIGRTGTFLAIHMTLQKLYSDPSAHIDIKETLLKLREQRNGMIQSEDQYKFVFVTLKSLLVEDDEKNSTVAP